LNEKKLPQPWKLADAPEDYIDKMLAAIVGLEIEIKEISGNTKMSQNHSDENRQGVIIGLNSQDKADVASWVENPNQQTKT